MIENADVLCSSTKQREKKTRKKTGIEGKTGRIKLNSKRAGNDWDEEIIIIYLGYNHLY